MVRGSRTAPITPKTVEATLVLAKLLKFVWLKTLNASARSCSFFVSPNEKFLKSGKSRRLEEGPMMMPRPALPRANGAVPEVGFGWKHWVLKNFSNVCGAPAFGSHNTFGRLPAMMAGMLPSPVGSKFAPVTVNGRPD